MVVVMAMMSGSAVGDIQTESSRRRPRIADSPAFVSSNQTRRFARSRSESLI
jgi:hypothetical protein